MNLNITIVIEHFFFPVWVHRQNKKRVNDDKNNLLIEKKTTWSTDSFPLVLLQLSQRYFVPLIFVVKHEYNLQYQLNSIICMWCNKQNIEKIFNNFSNSENKIIIKTRKISIEKVNILFYLSRKYPLMLIFFLIMFFYIWGFIHKSNIYIW